MTSKSTELTLQKLRGPTRCPCGKPAIGNFIGYPVCQDCYDKDRRILLHSRIRSGGPMDKYAERFSYHPMPTLKRRHECHA